MWSSNRRITVVTAALALAVVLDGCSRSEPCAPYELCNYEDDDCDGLIDEPFKNLRGQYNTVRHCGACGLDCREVYPSALEVICDTSGTQPRCRLVGCPEGTHPAGDEACVPDLDPLCLTCETDGDCTLFEPRSWCETVGVSRRCVRPCEPAGCPEGYGCTTDGSGLTGCRPASGQCECGPDNEGMTFPCLLTGAEEILCSGQRTCTADTLTECVPVLEEICDGFDNDCDLQVDEDFTTEDGRFVHPDHCGGCNQPCVIPGANMVAICTDTPTPTCVVECQEDFVDLDGVQSNGCECERTVGTWPPSRLGVDADCDGEIDDSDEFIFVTSRGNDANPGTLVFPMRTIPAALGRASSLDKTVLVASGTYAGPVDLHAGVDLFGGYSADFSDRDPDLYATVIRVTGGEGGRAVVRASDIRTATRMDGFTIVGTDASFAGTGSTTVLVTGCGPELIFQDVLIQAGRGAHGQDGDDSSENLSTWGMSSLLELDGADGTEGHNGRESSSPDCVGLVIDGGLGGQRYCPGAARAVDGGDGGDTICPHSGCITGLPCANAGCTDYMVDGVCDVDAVFADAVPNPPAGDGLGPGGGAGADLTYDPPTNRSTCSFCDDSPPLPRDGQDGQRGADGTDGEGGQGCVDRLGLFDASTGRWQSGDGLDGGSGTDGGGGGGGTCGSGYDVIVGVTGCNDVLGGSGGGGGSGGCGAPWASGGLGGGSSIGIAIILSAGTSQGPTLVDVRIITASAGDGGDGGIGGAGGAAGAGAPGGWGNFWCARRGGRGGDGGAGGAGGGGGGGCGGSVSGVHVVATTSTAEVYRAVLVAGVEVASLAAPGAGGSGGFSPGHIGSNGLMGDSQAIRILY